MISRLSVDQIFHASQKLSSRFPLINAVLSNKQSGALYAADTDEAFFVVHKSGFSYLRFADGLDESVDFLNLIIDCKEIPNYIHVYDPPESLIEQCVNHPLINIRLRNRIQLRYHKGDQRNNNNAQLPEGFQLERITASVFPLLDVFKLSLGNRYWNSEKDLLDNGFGFVMLNEKREPVSICYAACIADKVAEIDVATLEGFQKRGLGKQAVDAFANYCFENDISPNWDCFEDNHGSLRTAIGVGFQPVYAYRLLSIFNKSR